MEKQSDTRKIEQLMKRIAELEQTVGQKQIALEFYEKMIELAEQKYGIDIKKRVVRNAPVLLARTISTPLYNE